MPKWEVCRITDQYSRTKNHLLSASEDFSLLRAVLDTPNGEKVIFEKEVSADFPEVRAKLVAKLLADGWEPIATDTGGMVTTFRRQVS